MTDPVLVITAIVALAAGLPLLPGALRATAGVVGRAAARTVRSRPAAGVVAAMLLRPAAAGAVTPPPLLRMPLPPAGQHAPAPSEGAAVVPVAETGRYVVVPGDSLWAITARHLRAATGTDPSAATVDREWRRLYELNRDVVGRDPDLIFPGQRLIIPEEW